MSIVRLFPALLLLACFALLALLSAILAAQFILLGDTAAAVPCIVGAVLCIGIGAMGAYETATYR